MRLLSLFFAFYFAFFACMSCTDEATMCKDQSQTTAAATSHSDCGSNMLGDWCSPLCQCHCCGGAVVPLPAAPALAIVPVAVWGTSHRHARLVVAAPTRSSGFVWQPPQA